MNNTIIRQQESKYTKITENHDDKILWSEINWSVKHKEKSQGIIPVQLMADYFEKLYEPLDKNEKAEVDTLETNVYIPVPDPSITQAEMLTAQKSMKKGGYDISLRVLIMLM